MPNWVRLQNKLINVGHVSSVDIAPEGSVVAAHICMVDGKRIPVGTKDWPTIQAQLELQDSLVKDALEPAPRKPSVPIERHSSKPAGSDYPKSPKP